jgi:hypothetical protein
LINYLNSILLVCLLVVCSSPWAKGEGRNWLPRKSYVSLQYAGSIGTVSAGYFRASQNNKFEIGLTYGYLPKTLGGEIHTIALKTNFNPFRIIIKEQIMIEPIQVGSFVTQNFGKDLSLYWSGAQYPDDYYWWSRSVRIHLYLGSQMSYKIKHKYIDRIGLYIEANTNDLYISSFSGNNQALKITDIIFLGVGVKVYFKNKSDSTKSSE